MLDSTLPPNVCFKQLFNCARASGRRSRGRFTAREQWIAQGPHSRALCSRPWKPRC